MASRPLIRESLQLLTYVGMNPKDNNVLNKVIVIVQIISYIHLLIELTLQLVFKWNGLDSMEAFAVIGMIYQCIARVQTMITSRKIICRLLDKVDKFWPCTNYDSELQLEFNNIFALLILCFKILSAIFLAAIAGYLLRPQFGSVRTLPFDTYHPVDRYSHHSVPYWSMYILAAIDMFYGGFFVVAFDSLFISFIVQIVCELKALKKEFGRVSVGVDKDADEVESLKEVKRLVDHHNLVLECVKEMDEAYPLFLLNQFSCSIMVVCAGLITMIASGFPPPLMYLFKYSTLIITMLNQLFVYCAAGNYLITESESVSNAVYASDWYVKTQPNLRRAYVLMIQRANKTEKLTAGGMFTLNLESFTRVVRTSLSFFTLVQAMYTRTEN